MLKEVIGIIGLICIIIGNITIYKNKFIRRKYTYPLLIIGGICMAIYSISLGDKIFLILQIFFVIAAIYGLIKIHQRVKHNK